MENETEGAELEECLYGVHLHTSKTRVARRDGGDLLDKRISGF